MTGVQTCALPISLNKKMRYEQRVPEKLFEEDGHYLGRPADFSDRIVERRINLVNGITGFTGKNLSLLDIGCGNGASMF